MTNKRTGSLNEGMFSGIDMLWGFVDIDFCDEWSVRDVISVLPVKKNWWSDKEGLEGDSALHP